jgi:hypothetical protein
VPGAEQPERFAHPLEHIVFLKPDLARREGDVLLDGRGEERRFGKLEDEPHPSAQHVLFERPRIHAVH